MPLGSWNLNWLQHNAVRSYPFTADCHKRDVTGTIEIPQDFVVSLYFPISSGLSVEPHRFFLHTLGIFPTGYNLAVGYDDGTSDPPIVASVNIAKSTHTENRSYALPGVDDFDDSVGKVVIGSLDGIERLPPGVYRFDRDGAALETDCIRPMLRGISSLTVVSASGDRSPRLYGDIELVAQEDMQIAVLNADSGSPEILFSAIRGEGLNEGCECDDAAEGECIQTINGIPPDGDGNFRLSGTDCLTIESLANGVQLADACTEPCCGCEELDALNRQIQRFADGASTLQNFTTDLRAEVTQFHAVVLGSRLADGQGCVG